MTAALRQNGFGGDAAAARRSRRARLRSHQAWVRRSVVALIEDRQAEQRQCRTEQPEREIERTADQQQRAAAEQLHDRARLAALRFREPRRACDVLRAFGDAQRIHARRACRPSRRRA